jgi:hypothetical protein
VERKVDERWHWDRKGEEEGNLERRGRKFTVKLDLASVKCKNPYWINIPVPRK